MTEAEEAELHSRFDALGRDLAAALDTDPTTETGWWHQVQRWVYGAVTLYHPTGLVLRLEHRQSTEAARGRLTVRGVTPRGWSGRRTFEIGVSIGRPLGDIAREIRRRLLPEYTAAMPGALAEVAAAERLRLARIEAMRSLIEALPALHTYDWDSEQSAGSFYPDPYHRPQRAHASGTVRVSQSADTADLKLTGVPLHLARAVLALLRRPDAVPPDGPPA
ncbi:hypothetical protein ACIRPK_23815 [Kitasatospora sp. NPDC101801]